MSDDGMKRKTFTAFIYKDKESHWYIAECPEVEVTTQGETVGEAVEMLQDAVRGIMEVDPDRDIDECEGLPIVRAMEVTWDAPTVRHETR